MSDIAARGLHLTYAGRPPVDALRGVDLTVPDGGLTAVLGPSGSGKSTLLQCIAGTQRPGAGQLRIGGDVVLGPGVHVPPERRHVSLVPQEGALFPHLDVAGNIAFGLRALTRQARRGRVDELLDLVGLAGLGSRRPHELSGGQQQRVALARALAPRPRVVLLDEPFSALDASLRAALREEVAATLRRAGTTAVLVTHDQDEALTMADTVAVVHEGRVLQTGTPAEVFWGPHTLWVAQFLGSAVVLPGHVAGRTARCLLGSYPLAAGTSAPDGPATVVVRPEQLVRADPAATGAKATVLAVRFHGPDATLTLRLEGQELQARWSSVDLPQVGDVVPLSLVGTVVALTA